MPMFKKSLFLLLIMVVGILGGTIYGNVKSDDVKQLDAATTQKDVQKNFDGDEEDDEDEEKIFVYVTGAVNKPGMVELDKKNSRAADAINACGGLSPTADTDNFNPAQEISDGQHIRVPEKIVELENQSFNSNENSFEKNSSNKKADDVIVNINTAGLEELQKLNGIGPKMAERIIEYRQTNGNFKTVEEIQKVRGIGPKKFEKMKNHIRI